MQPILLQKPKLLERLSIFINIGAITLYPLIISRTRMHVFTYNHEKIHFRQQEELWVLGFYPLYVMFWLYYRIRGFNSYDAYMMIPFEREAYAMEQILEYPDSRKRFSWVNYIKL